MGLDLIFFNVPFLFTNVNSQTSLLYKVEANYKDSLKCDFLEFMVMLSSS